MREDCFLNYRSLSRECEVSTQQKANVAIITGVLQINAHVTLWALKAFVFTVVPMVPGRNVSNKCCWIGTAYYKHIPFRVLQYFFLQHPISFDFIPFLFHLKTVLQIVLFEFWTIRSQMRDVLKSNLWECTPIVMHRYKLRLTTL